VTIGEGETVALVGESGSGKSVTARLVLGLLQDLKHAAVSGRISFAGEDLSQMTAVERRKLRGTAISMIFQDPTSALNPVYTIGKLFREVLRRADPNITPRRRRRVLARRCWKSRSVSPTGCWPPTPSSSRAA